MGKADWDFMTPARFRKVEREGPPTAETLEEAQWMIRALWAERRSHAWGKLFWFYAFLAMSITAAVGWAL